MIKIGITDEGKQIEIPVFHTGTFGQTGIGKTRLLKYMISQASEEGYRVLIIDSKLTTEKGKSDFENISTVPFMMEESTDPDVFQSLIEGMRTRGKGDMRRYRGGFIEICDGARNFKEIGANLEAKLSDKKIRGGTRMMYYEINHDYKRLMDLIGNYHFVQSISFGSHKIVRMPTWELPNLNLQGLVVRAAVDWLLRNERKLILLLDEAPNFVSQKMYNPAKDAIMRLDAQGRNRELFGWYSGQNLTGFDKSNMKNLWYWIIGREMEPNEADDAYAVQTYKKLSKDEIRRLKVREFFIATPDFTEKVTVPLLEVEDVKNNHKEEEKRRFEKGEEENWADVAYEIRRLEEAIRNV
jgi:hypothetical protein